MAQAAKKESLVTRRELAELHGVHQQTVTKWERAGMPIAERGRRGVPSRYNPDDVAAWLEERKKSTGGGGLVVLTRERARKERALARLNELKYQEMARELVPADEVAEIWGAHINAVRTKLLSLPTTLTDRLCRAAKRGPRAVERELEDAIRGVLTELADGDVADELETQELCGALTSSGTPCRNKAKENGRCHIPSHQKA